MRGKEFPVFFFGGGMGYNWRFESGRVKFERKGYGEELISIDFRRVLFLL